MKNTFSLSIPNLCAEKWHNFTHTTNGRFCSSCSKVVIDFTKMSDDEILNYFTDKPDSNCGRFRADQLKVYSHIPPVDVKPSLTLLKAGFISLALMLMNKQTSAQTTSINQP